MRFNRRARLDSREVQRRTRSGGGGRGRIPMGGGGKAIGGAGGVVVVLVVLAIQVLGGGGGGLDVLSGLDGVQVGGGPSAVEPVEGCRTGADAERVQECRIVAVVNSVQDTWEAALGSRYQPAVTNFFTGSVRTGGCGTASSAVGPFYCPADAQVYIDLSFFEVLEERFGASGGDFAEAYVIAHEYGHHVQNLLGLRARDRSSGAESDAVRQELQADCFAGVWAHDATTTPDPRTGEILILELTEQDIREALSAAAAVGDDRIQEAATGDVNPESWTHGSAEQRQRWFLTGFADGDPDDCDTFSAEVL